jgi:hypothetical protein
MSAEITTIRTAAETTAAPLPPTLDAATLTAVTGALRAAADLARAQRPIILHEPAPTPAIRPGTATYGADVRIPSPPPTSAAPTAVRVAHGRRPAMFGDKVLCFGTGAILSGVAGAIIALTAGYIWVLTISAAGAALVAIGAAAINHAETRRGTR